MSAHGTQSRYITGGCRCVPCTVAATEAHATRRIIRASERILVDGRLIHPGATHGNTSGYTYYSCRCHPCTATHSGRRVSFRAAKQGAVA